MKIKNIITLISCLFLFSFVTVNNIVAEEDNVISINSPSTESVGQNVPLEIKVPCNWSIAEVSWEYGDGETADTKSHITSHKYDFEGIFMVTATVTAEKKNSDGTTSTYTFSTSKNVVIKK